MPHHHISPFTDVQWEGDVPLVEFEEQWWNLVSVNGTSCDSLVLLTKQEDDIAWRDQFGLNFPFVLLGLGHAEVRNIRMVLRHPETGELSTRSNITMLKNNWYELAYNRYVVRQRVNRTHSTEMPAELSFIPGSNMGDFPGDGPSTETSPISGETSVAIYREWLKAKPNKWAASLPRVLTRLEIEQDLDQLEWLLENRYSYLHRTNAPYQAAFDAIRANLQETTPRNDFGLQVQRALGLFGDLHCRVRENSALLNWNGDDLHSPFFAVLHGERVVALRPDRDGFMVPDAPFIKSMGDKPIGVWREAARQLLKNGTPSLLRAKEGWTFETIGLVYNTLGYQGTMLDVEFESEDGSYVERKTYNLLQYVDISSEPRPKREVLPNNVAYLPITRIEASQRFLDKNFEFMSEDARHADGLIIDLRGNFGGKRQIIDKLLPFFIDPETGPRVINIRVNRQNESDHPGYECFPAETRFFHPEESSEWTDDERAAIRKANAKFKPELSMPGDKFNGMYYWVVSPGDRTEGYFYFDKPVVVLTDHRCYSVADVLAGALDDLPNVTLLGETTAGGSGRSRTYRLYNSQLVVRMPTMASFRASGQLYDGNGVAPDIQHSPSLSDIAGKTDTGMEKALRTLQAKIREDE